MRTPDYPEFLLLVLLAGLVTVAALWIHASRYVTWNLTLGYVLEGQLDVVHVNAPEYLPKVRVRYAYTVDGVRYADEYTGLWPQAYSPNALPHSQLTQLTTEGHPLTILYNPNDPGQSSLHGASDARRDFFFWSFVILLLVTIYYVARMYPHLRA